MLEEWGNLAKRVRRCANSHLSCRSQPERPMPFLSLQFSCLSYPHSGTGRKDRINAFKQRWANDEHAKLV